MQTKMSRISVGSPAPSVHSATAVELPDGSIRAFWFGGSREGATDVAIWSASWKAGKWAEPSLAVSRDQVARATGRYVRKLGNPVAYVSDNGRITLFVVSVALGGWSGSAIDRLVLDSDGKTILSARRLVASPVLNVGTLVRGAVIEGGAGELLLPAYHETVRKFPLLLRIGREGKVLTRGGPKVRGDLFQPWQLVSEDDGHEIFLRRGEGTAPRVHYSRSATKWGSDVGEWTAPVPIPVSNPNSGISALRLDDGSILLAANPETDSRETLSLLRAKEVSGPWSVVFTVDNPSREDDEKDLKRVEYSYPWLMHDHEGAIHLFYTWNRREIRHWYITPSDLGNGRGGNR